jgi:hypothetical protein
VAVEDESIRAAWQEAGRDLGIAVVAPFVLETASGSVTFPVFLPDFGGKKGMVVGLLGGYTMSAEHRSAAKTAHLYFSGLDPDSYSSFDRDLFVGTLNDWGWYGADGERPAWYTGAPWR